MQKQRSPKYPMRISIHSIKKKKTEPHRNDANSIVLWRVLSLVYQKICQLFVNLKFIQHYSMPENSAYLPLHI